MGRFHRYGMSSVVVLVCLGVVQSGRTHSRVSAAAGFMPLEIIGSPNALSSDGTVIVGQFVPPGGTGVRAFRWTEETGQVDLGTLSGGTTGASAASFDGSAIVGFASSPSLPWRWTAATGMLALGPLPPGFISGSASDVSADGTVVVGLVTAPNLPSGVAVFRPFRWTAATGIVPLGTLDDKPQTRAFAVSADGAVLVGQSLGDAGYEAFRWTVGTGLIGLGSLPGFRDSSAQDTSADGNVVVGTTSLTFGEGPAFRWTPQEGMVSLGDLPGGMFASFAHSVSADGSTIVGHGHDGTPVGQFGDRSVFIWDAVHGMRALRDVLLEQGIDVGGWRLSFPFGMSADGRVIGGLGINPAGTPQAWLAHLAATDSCTQPSIVTVAATPSVLWPPNHKLIPVSVAVNATAVCGPPVCRIVSIISDEPSRALGDIIITGDLTAFLRADRSGGSTGRTYTITVECRDTAGHVATKTAVVRVPHDQGR